MTTLNAFVLFSVLASDFRAFKIPTITASMGISPADDTANAILQIRLRQIEVSEAWDSILRDTRDG